MQLSEPNNKLNLISSSNFSETEFKSVKILKIENKYTDFSEPEPKLKNSFELFPQLGRVKVVKHNLGIIYFLFFTLYLFRGTGAKEFKQKIEARWDEERAKTSSISQTWLIPQPISNSWGDKRPYNKVNLVKDMIGYKPKINTKDDERNMRLYLRQSFKDKLVIPKSGLDEEFLPMGAPLLDFLTVETEGPTGWKYPRLEDLRKYQSNRGLTFSVLEEVKVREIICGISTNDEIKKFHEWITEKHIKNQDKFDTGVISMDVEDVKASYYDVMRMVGKIVIEKPGIQVFKTRIDDRAVPGIREDGWKQTPGKIMFGDGITWTAIISLPYKR